MSSQLVSSEEDASSPLVSSGELIGSTRLALANSLIVTAGVDGSIFVLGLLKGNVTSGYTKLDEKYTRNECDCLPSPLGSSVVSHLLHSIRV